MSHVTASKLETTTGQRPEIGYTAGLAATVRDLWSHRDVGKPRGA